MNQDQIGRVKTSFSAVMPRMDAFARRFYDRLFSADPSLRALFSNDMAEQRRKLMLTLSTVIHELADLSRLMPSIQDLAVRHVSYGVEARHYPAVGAALIAALKDEVPGFTDEDERAWAAAYGALSGAMTAAAYKAAA